MFKDKLVPSVFSSFPALAVFHFFFFLAQAVTFTSSCFGLLCILDAS